MDRDQLAREYLPLAEERARRLAYRDGFPVDEARSAALVGLAEAIERYEAIRGDFAPYARTTIDGQIRNAARAWRWRRRATPIEGRELAEGDDVIAIVPDRLTTIELAEARTDITRALAALSDTERQVILLRGKLGHTFPATAAILGLDEDHAKYLWRRALERMRTALDVDSGDPQTAAHAA